LGSGDCAVAQMYLDPVVSFDDPRLF